MVRYCIWHWQAEVVEAVGEAEDVGEAVLEHGDKLSELIKRSWDLSRLSLCLLFSLRTVFDKIILSGGDILFNETELAGNDATEKRLCLPGFDARLLKPSDPICLYFCKNACSSSFLSPKRLSMELELLIFSVLVLGLGNVLALLLLFGISLLFVSMIAMDFLCFARRHKGVLLQC